MQIGYLAGTYADYAPQILMQTFHLHVRCDDERCCTHSAGQFVHVASYNQYVPKPTCHMYMWIKGVAIYSSQRSNGNYTQVT